MKQFTLLHAWTLRCSSYADCLGTQTAYLAPFVESTYESSDTSIYIKQVRVLSYVNLVNLFKTFLLIIRGIVIFFILVMRIRIRPYYTAWRACLFFVVVFVIL